MQKLSFALVATLSFGALAAPPSSSSTAAQNAGVRAFEDGRYAEAVQLFSDAYRVRPQPLLLLSIAKARFRLKQLDEAKQCLFDYLRDDPNGVSGSEAFDLLTRIEKERPTSALERPMVCVAPAASPPPSAAKPSDAQPAPAAKAPQIQTAGTATASAQPAAPPPATAPSPWIKDPSLKSPPKGDAKPAAYNPGVRTGAPLVINEGRRGYWSYSLLAASAVAAGAGAYFGLQNLSATNDWRNATTPTAISSAHDRASSAARSANIAWVATGALAATGLGLLLFTRF